MTDLEPCNTSHLYIITTCIAGIGAVLQATLYFYYRKQIFWCERNNLFIEEKFSEENPNCCANNCRKFLVGNLTYILIFTEIIELGQLCLNIYYFTVGSRADNDQNVKLPNYWYILSVLSALFSLSAVFYGCRLCYNAHNQKDDKSEWTYRYVIFLLVSFTELPLTNFLQYFWIERVLVVRNSNLSATILANHIFSLVYIIIICWTMSIILRPFVKNICQTKFIDALIIISMILMFLSLVASFVTRLISVLSNSPMISHDFFNVEQWENRCPQFVFHLTDPAFNGYDRAMLALSGMVWGFGMLAFTVFGLSLITFEARRQSIRRQTSMILK